MLPPSLLARSLAASQLDGLPVTVLADSDRVNSPKPIERQVIMREIRVSPDGDTVAIRTDAPEGAPNAWGCFSVTNGGHWCATKEVADWTRQPRLETEATG